MRNKINNLEEVPYDATLRHRHATLAPPLSVGDPLGSPHMSAPHSSYRWCLHAMKQSQRHVEKE